MTRYCFLDTETKAPLNIKKAGTIRYVESCTPLMVQWMEMHEPEPHVWEIHRGPIPDALRELLESDDVIFVAANSMFDRHVVGWQMSYRKLRDPARWLCTAALTRQLGLMGGLEKAGRRLGLPDHLTKNTNGMKYINRFCVQTRREWCRPEDDPQMWGEFVDYGKQDVVACREVFRRGFKRMPPKALQHWRDVEHRVFLLDQKINDRGFVVDPAVLSSALQMIGTLQPRLETDVARLTNGRITAVQSPKLRDFLAEAYDCHLENLQKATIAEALDLCEDGAGQPLHPIAYQVLRVRQIGARNSLAKYGSLETMMSKDGRVRAGFLYHGAHPGRFSGQSAQPHNLPRPTEDDLDPVEIAEAILAARGDVEVLEMLFDPHPFDVLVSGIRGAVRAAPGHRLVIGDYRQVESVCTAWFAGQWDKLDAYVAFNEGQTDLDTYQQTAIDVLGVSAEQVREQRELRQLGKIMDLGLGFGLGAPKFAAINRKSAAWAKKLVQPWRERYKYIPQLWKGLETWIAWLSNSDHAGSTAGLTDTVDNVLHWLRERNFAPEVIAGFTRRRKGVKQNLPHLMDLGVDVSRHDTSTLLWLPSGKPIYYNEARNPTRREQRRDTDDVADEDFQVDDDRRNRWAVAYRNQYGSSRPSHGGKLVENLVQGTCRELLVWHMLELDRRGWSIVLHAHDEPVLEVPEDQVERAKVEMLEVMTTVPDWLPNMPLYADVFDTPRYTKK